MLVHIQLDVHHGPSFLERSLPDSHPPAYALVPRVILPQVQEEGYTLFNCEEIRVTMLNF